MLGKDLIKRVREDRAARLAYHRLYEKTNGIEGFRCFNPEALEALMTESDEDIIKKALANGAYISDAEKYIKNN